MKDNKLRKRKRLTRKKKKHCSNEKINRKQAVLRIVVWSFGAFPSPSPMFWLCFKLKKQGKICTFSSKAFYFDASCTYFAHSLCKINIRHHIIIMIPIPLSSLKQYTLNIWSIQAIFPFIDRKNLKKWGSRLT